MGHVWPRQQRSPSISPTSGAPSVTFCQSPTSMSGSLTKAVGKATVPYRCMFVPRIDNPRKATDQIETFRCAGCSSGLLLSRASGRLSSSSAPVSTLFIPCLIGSAPWVRLLISRSYASGQMSSKAPAREPSLKRERGDDKESSLSKRQRRFAAALARQVRRHNQGTQCH